MILIAFGSNLNFGKQSPRTLVIGALGALNQFVDVTAVSKFYVSASWPDPSQPDYINGVAAISTGLAPEVFLAGLHALEASFGRRRAEMNAPRTLDLDLLAYKNRIRGGGLSHGGGKKGRNGLILPHPRMASRDFVLAPLCDIAPDWPHPQLKATARELLDALPEISVSAHPDQPVFEFLRRNSCN